MARTIQNNARDLKAIKDKLGLFLVDYFKDNLNINESDDTNILLIQKRAIFDKLKSDIKAYLYGDGVRYKTDFDFGLSYDLKHNNDFDIDDDLQAVFDKAFKERLKAIKEHQRAVERVTIDYYLKAKIQQATAQLIDYTKSRYKTTTSQAIEYIKADNVKQGLFEDIKSELIGFTSGNLNYETIERLFNQEYDKAIKHHKQQTPRATSQEPSKSNKLVNAFLLLKKW